MNPTNPDNDDRKLFEVRAAVQSSGATWEAGATSMSELPLERFRRRLGAVPPPGAPTLEAIAREAAARRPMLMAERASAGAPASYDLRNVGGKNFITSVKDQGDCGSCVAFGVCATIEGTVRKSKDDPAFAVDLSEARIYWWILDESDARAKASEMVNVGHFASLFQDELYELRTGRAGVTRLHQFGVIFGYERVVLVDAAFGGGRPGAVRRFDAGRGRLPWYFRSASP